MSCGIYKFENKINHMVYIGQAIDLDARKEKHKKNIYDKKHQENLYLALREYGWDNFSYEILESFDAYDFQQLNELENYYIDKYNSLTPFGYNMVPGGCNGAGLAKSKIVQQYDIDGKFIAEFSSAREADRKTGINYSDICACCRENTNKKQAGGFQWKYKDSSKEILPLQVARYRKHNVYQFSLDDVLVNVYSSLKEASEKTGIAKSTISNCCNHKAYTAGKYKWSYDNESPNINNKYKRI